MARVITELAQVAERLESLRSRLEADAEVRVTVRRLERENRRLRSRAWRWRVAAVALGLAVAGGLLKQPEMLDALLRALTALGK